MTEGNRRPVAAFEYAREIQRRPRIGKFGGCRIVACASQKALVGTGPDRVR